MKKILIFIILLCFCRCVFGSEIDTYEVIGQDITVFHEKATDICQHEIVRYDKLCDELKKRSKKLKNMYITAGNLLTEKNNTKKYMRLKIKIIDELSELYKLIGGDYEKEKL